MSATSSPTNIPLRLSVGLLDVLLLKLLGHLHIFYFLLCHVTLLDLYVEASNLSDHRSLRRILVFLFGLFFVLLLLLYSWQVLSSIRVGHVEEHLKEDAFVSSCLQIKVFDQIKVRFWKGFLRVDNAD